MKNKKGWLRVVEAFLAILMIGGVILIIINQNTEGEKQDLFGIYENELVILREVQLNAALRSSILMISDSSLPVELNDSAFPQDVEDKIENKIPPYLTCNAKICDINQECIANLSSTSDVYTKQSLIFANLQVNNPRKLAIACGVK
jgi:hypothetical protein